MREAVKSEEQAAEALDDDTEEGEEDNAIEMQELRGPTQDTTPQTGGGKLRFETIRASASGKMDKTSSRQN